MNVWFCDVNSFPAGDSHIKYYFDNETTPRVDMPINKFFGGAAAPFGLALFVHGSHQAFCDPILSIPVSYSSEGDDQVDLNRYCNPYPAACYQYTYLAYPKDADVQTWTGPRENSAVVRKQWTNMGVDPRERHGKPFRHQNGRNQEWRNGQRAESDRTGLGRRSED